MGSSSSRKDEEMKELLNHSDEDKPTTVVKSNGKRKRKVEEDISITSLAEVFLRIMYPLAASMSKCLTVGLFKPLNYSPTVMLHHGSKMLLFSEVAWDSFVKHLHLIECYLANNIVGRKTNARLLESDIEIDVVKQRGEQQIRFRNLTKHEDKVLLTREEFFTLSAVASAVTRYVKQLAFSGPILQDYLIHTMETQPDVPILYSPIDTSIFNRIPYEVEIWRRIRDYEAQHYNDSTEEDESTENRTLGEEEEEEDSAE